MQSVLQSWNIQEEDFYNARTVENKVKHILRYGQLAPSTHNTQPWLININKNTCAINIDPSLKLPQADPSERNIYISIGCFIANTIVAASYYGINTSLSFSNNKYHDVISTITFRNILAPQKNKSLSKLKSLSTITNRVTYRGLFDQRIIPKSITDRIRALSTPEVRVFVYTSKSEINDMAEITAASVNRVATKKAFREELSQWMRPSNTSKYDGIPGYSYGFPYLVSLVTPYMMRVLNPSSMMAKKSRSTVESSSIATIVATNNNSKRLWIETGIVSEQIILLLQDNNIRTSINVAAIQDQEGFRELSRIVGNGYIPQFIMFSGHADNPGIPTPRHNIENKIQI